MDSRHVKLLRGGGAVGTGRRTRFCGGVSLYWLLFAALLGVRFTVVLLLGLGLFFLRRVPGIFRFFVSVTLALALGGGLVFLLFVDLSLHFLHAVLAAFTVVRRVFELLAEFDQGDLAAGVDAEFLVGLFEAVGRDIGVVLLALVLGHDDALVLSARHEGVPHQGARSHRLLESVLRVDLQQLLESVAAALDLDADVEVNFESDQGAFELAHGLVEIGLRELHPLDLTLGGLLLLRSRQLLGRKMLLDLRLIHALRRQLSDQF